MSNKRFLSHRKYPETSSSSSSTTVHILLLCCYFFLLLSSSSSESHYVTTAFSTSNKAIVSRPPSTSFSHHGCSSGSRKRLIRSGSSSLSAAAQKNKMIATTAFSVSYTNTGGAVDRDHIDSNKNSSNSNKKNNYLRWNRTPDAWEMQTAVTVFERKNKIGVERVHLHAQLHYGSRAYYEYYNAPSFTLSQHDAVLYELLLDENLLMTSSSTSSSSSQNKNKNIIRYMKPGTSIQASSHDHKIASQYGWTCQADAIRYAKSGGSKWIHADLTRQEFLNQLNQNNEKVVKATEKDQPLWQQAAAAAASSKRSSSNPLLAMAGSLPLVSEAATALLVGPPLVVESSATADSTDFDGGSYGLPRGASSGTAAVAATEFRQSIFSQTISILRSVLWMTVPAPEISVLLLDWSALLFVNTASEKDINNNKNVVQLGSPWVYEVLQQLVQGRIQAVRQLYFGQIVLTGQNKDDDSLLVTHRNQHAMKVLQQVLNQQQQDDTTAAASGGTDVALLYGCHHCDDLHKRLNRMGFTPVSKHWRTAFDIPRVDVSSKSDRTRNMESFLSSWTNSIEQNPTPTVGIMVLILSYLAIGGMDWIATWQDVISSASFQAASSDAILYLIRHVMLYVALSKLLLDPNWTGSSSSGSVDGE